MQKEPFDSRTLLGISHVALKANDMEKSLAFYCDFLGFAEQSKLYYRDGNLMMVLIKVNDEQSIEIFDASRLKPDTDPLYQIAFRVEDAEAVRSHLSSKGYAVPPKVPIGQTKNANFTVEDGCGYIVEFVQHMQDGVTEQQKGQFLPDSRISNRITHAGVVVKDMGQARRFYEDTLNFRETWRGSANDKEVSWIHVKLSDNDDFLEWMLNSQTPPHFCLHASNVDAIKAELEQRPYFHDYVKRGRKLETQIGKNLKRQLNLWDPDGIRVEFMEPNTFDGSPLLESSDHPLPANLL